MAAPTAAIRTNTTGPYAQGADGMLAEPIRVTGGAGGSVVGDTFTYVCQFINDVRAISPGYSIQSSSTTGLTVTLTIELQHAIGAGDVEDVEIIGYIG